VIQKKNVFTAVKIMAIGVTWLMSCEGEGGGGGAKSTVGIRSPVKLAKTGLNHSLINIHSFPTLPQFFYLPLFNAVAKENILREKKYWGGAFAPTPP